jgi:quercetin dioxygenase-like cupin family protein
MCTVKERRDKEARRQRDTAEGVFAMTDGGSYKNNIVTSYVADTSKFKDGKVLSPVVFIDSNSVPGSFYAEYVIYNQATEGSPPEHSHDESDEMLMFFGSDPEHPHELGGEMELWIAGEKYTLTESAMIFVPKGVKHCPLYCRRADRPILMVSTAPAQYYSRDGIE